MKKNQYILSIDQGTTSCRAILFDANGKKIFTAQKEFKQYFPNDGWVEHDPLEILEKQILAIREAINESGIGAGEIKGIGITNQRETTVVWDKHTGIPIHKAIVWQDRRTSDYCESLKVEGYEKLIQEKTGLIIDSYFSATKIKYILDQDPKARVKAKNGNLLFGTIDTWLIWNLTQEKNHFTDVTNASRTMLYNIHQMEWDDQLLALFDIPSSILPEVKSCDDHFGTSSIALLGVEAPIRGVAGDQQAALFGQTCFEEGYAKNTYGTGCFLMLNTGGNAIISKGELITTIAWKLNGKTNYALEGSIFIGGALIEWLKDGLGFFEKSNASEALAESIKSSEGVVFIPALTGLGAPYWDQYARGSIFGITRATTKAHITRAAIESIALQVMDLVNVMQSDTGKKIKSLKVDGGVSQNNLLMQIQSDLLEIEIDKAKEQESTAFGVALIAGLSIGLWKNLDQLKSLRKSSSIFQPQKAIKDYHEMISLFHRGIERTKGWIKH